MKKLKVRSPTIIIIVCMVLLVLVASMCLAFYFSTSDVYAEEALDETYKNRPLGKNKFDLPQFAKKVNGTIRDNTLTFYDWNDSIPSNFKFDTYIEAGTYILSYSVTSVKIDFAVYFYNGKTKLDNTYHFTETKLDNVLYTRKFKFNQPVTSILFENYGNLGKYEFKNFQLEQGDTVTAYEPFYSYNTIASDIQKENEELKKLNSELKKQASEAYNDGLNDVQNIFPSLFGSVGDFFKDFFALEFWGISLGDIFALLVSIGSILLVVKLLRG